MDNFFPNVQLHFDECNDHYNGRVWVTMLYGSQNYGLNTSLSDVDTKTMLLPTPKEVILGTKMVSTDLLISDGGLSNTKDYRAMFHNYLKGNINFVETLFTDWYIVNECYEDFFDELRAHRDQIANCRPNKLVHMAAGMANQKYVAMTKHFDSKEEVLAKYGYDPKQLHHLARLREFIRCYLNTHDFGACLHPDAGLACYLMGLKTSPLPYEEAIAVRDICMRDIDGMVQAADSSPIHADNEYEYERAKAFMDDLTVRLFMQVFGDDLDSVLR